MENRVNLKPFSSMNNTHQIRNSTAEFLIFATQNESDTIEVRYEIGTLWLSQKWMAKLFDCSSDNISLHLKNIFATGELNPNSVTEDFSTTAADDETMAYIGSSTVNALMAVELLYGDAAHGKEIASHKANLMSIPEYVKTVKGLKRTIESADVIGK